MLLVLHGMKRARAKRARAKRARAKPAGVNAPRALLLAAFLCAACAAGSRSTADAGSGSDGGSCSPAGAGVEGACLGSTFLGALGKSKLLIGATMADATASAVQWDVRYLYLAGGIADGAGPCVSCASACTASGHSCANGAGGCGWWGCYQYDQNPPGQYVRDFVSANKAANRVPLFTWYELLQSMNPPSEGMDEVTKAATDAALMARYWNNYRFFLKQIGNEVALIQIEPDFWGYAQHAGANPHALGARVASANPSDCGCQEESIAGMGSCFISMARKYAPNAKIGLHASAWGTGVDATLNLDPTLNVPAEAAKLAAFLLAVGAGGGDFLTVDASDRDAGYYRSIGRSAFWDATNTKLPHFHQALAWAKALAEGAGRPILWWQVPVGNPGLPDRNNEWQDNRVDYFFAHPDELVAAHSAGVFFGAGAGGMTTPETDGNNLVTKAKAYFAAGGTQLCH